MGEKMKIDNVIIYCENRKEFIAVLEYLEEYTDILWRSGKKPLKQKDYLLDDINVLIIKDGILTYNRSIHTYHDFIDNKTINNLTKISAMELFGFCYDMPLKKSLMDFLFGEENV